MFRQSRCQIYTRFSVEDFASGSSSLSTLKVLLAGGYPVYEIERLHAKLVAASGSFASIGSQNLTFNGVNNREGHPFRTQTEVGRVQENAEAVVGSATRDNSSNGYGPIRLCCSGEKTISVGGGTVRQGYWKRKFATATLRGRGKEPRRLERTAKPFPLQRKTALSSGPLPSVFSPGRLVGNTQAARDLPRDTHCA